MGSAAESNGVDVFYVGTHGNFDKVSYRILLEFETKYNIDFHVVLSAMPSKNTGVYKNTIVPEGIEEIPPRWGIDYRNKWMIRKSDYVITYVNRNFGGRQNIKNMLKAKEKTSSTFCECHLTEKYARGIIISR